MTAVSNNNNVINNSTYHDGNQTKDEEKSTARCNVGNETNTDTTNAEKIKIIQIRSEHIYKIAAELLMDFS